METTQRHPHRRPALFSALIACGVAAAMASVAEAGMPYVVRTTVRMPAKRLMPVARVARLALVPYRYAPRTWQPTYATYQTFKPVVPTTTVVVTRPMPTQVVAIPAATPVDLNTVTAALPAWYLTTQSLRPVMYTETPGVTVVNSLPGPITTFAY